MNQTIKKRIEDIKNGIVPEGYKKTKVGIVPIEWEESRLSKYLVLNNEKNKECKYLREDVFSISGEQGVVNQIKHMGRSYAGESLDNYGVVYPMDIVYTKSPLKDNPYGIIKTNLTGTTGIVSVLYAVYKPRENVVPKYVQYYFENDIVLNNYLLPIVEIGPKHTMNIGDKQSLQGVVAFATKKEQEKITEILSEHDILIKLKEKLIEQKKQQKKYLMQQLLTGKKRLPGFTDEWIEYPISRFLEIRNERQLPTVEAPLKAFVAEKGIVEKGSRYDRSFLVKSDDKEYKRTELWDFIYSSNNLDVGSIGLNTYGSAVISIVYEIFKVKSTTLPILISEIIQLTENMQKILKYRQGALYGQYKIYAEDFLSVKILMPELNEQQAIADILLKADKEIELLQKDLEEEKNKKKALMQLLLTGIVRVV